MPTVQSHYAEHSAQWKLVHARPHLHAFPDTSHILEGLVKEGKLGSLDTGKQRPENTAGPDGLPVDIWGEALSKEDAPITSSEAGHVPKYTCMTYACSAGTKACKTTQKIICNQCPYKIIRMYVCIYVHIRYVAFIFCLHYT